MAAKHLMISIDWFGPYRSIEEANAAAKQDYGAGLYLAIGGQRYERGGKKPQYVGIGNPLCSRLVSTHHKLSMLRSRGLELWLGEVATAEPAGRKAKRTPATLDYAEWLHARFMKLPLNEKKTKGRPPRPVSVLNRWYNIDYEWTAPLRRPHPDWPDFIDFLDDELPARALFFSSRRRRIYQPPDFVGP